MWITLFDHSFNFSKAYDKVMRALTIIDVILLASSYLDFAEIHAPVYDKFSWALTASNWSNLIFNERSGW